MKPGTAVVNVGRAGLLDEAALVDGLRDGRLSGAAIDVPAREPLTPPDPLLDLPGVLVTPHSAWYSLDAVVELRTKAAEEVARVLRGEPPLHPARS
jgi:phosphoglycerate dehydrogenase-like enzyme